MRASAKNIRDLEHGISKRASRPGKKSSSFVTVKLLIVCFCFCWLTTFFIIGLLLSYSRIGHHINSLQSKPLSLSHEISIPERASHFQHTNEIIKDSLKVDKINIQASENEVIGNGVAHTMSPTTLEPLVYHSPFDFDDSDKESIPDELIKKISKLKKSLPRRWSTAEKNPIRIVVIGDDWVIKRDLPLIKSAFESTGIKFEFIEATNVYASARRESSSHHVTIRSIPKVDDWDLVLCLAVSSCLDLKDFDARFSTNSIITQRINRVPILREILWNKNEFCHTVKKYVNNSRKSFSFPCWVLGDSSYKNNDDKDLIEYAMKHKDEKLSWIVKPWASGGGRGIQVVDGVSGIRNIVSARNKVIVQPYLANPLLIKGRKIDLRCYVLVTSIYPIRSYIHSRGLVRFASSEYKSDAPRGGDRTAFLTNTSVNGNVTSLTWTFKQLCEYLGKDRCSTVFESIDEAIGQVLHVSSPRFSKIIKRGSNNKETQYVNCYQLLGVDVIIDDLYKPRVIEVNGEPSMKSSGDKNSDYDHTKMKVMHDVAALLFADSKYSSNLPSAMKEKSKQQNPQLWQMIEEDDDLARNYILHFYESSVNLQHEFREIRPIFPP